MRGLVAFAAIEGSERSPADVRAGEFVVAESTPSPVERALSAISLKSLINGFGTYRESYVKFLRQRRSFAVSTIIPKGPDAFSFGSVLFFYGVALSFVVYVPLIYVNGIKFGKLFFLLQFTYVLASVAFLIYLAARVFRGVGTFSLTAAAFAAWTGLVAPAVLVLDYPLFVYYPVEDFLAEIDPRLPSALPSWVQLWNSVVFVLMMAASVWLLFGWIADVHKITRRRVVLGFLVIYMPLGVAHQFYVLPWVSKALRVIAEMLQLV